MTHLYIFVPSGNLAGRYTIVMGSVRLVSFSFSRNWIFGVSFRGSLRFGSVRGYISSKAVRFGSVSHLYCVLGMHF